MDDGEPGTPMVSVVIPCFGQAGFLQDAVSSVVAQTLQDWEVVIVDDGSRDDTAEVAEGLAALHGPRIRLVRQPNQGVAAARNTGIAASRGRFVMPLDADDRIAPQMLEATAAALDDDPAAAIAYTDYREFGGRTMVMRVPEFDPDRLCFRNFMPTTALIRRSVFDAVGGYNPNMVHGYEDWDFWVTCAEHGLIARRIPRVLFEYRVRSGTRSEGASAAHRALLGQMALNHTSFFTRSRRTRGIVKRVPGAVRLRLERLAHRLRSA